jgi:hypothetical protein
MITAGLPLLLDSFARFAIEELGPPAPVAPRSSSWLPDCDRSAYAKFTGLERLPTKNPAMSLDRCPLELQPKRRQEVARFSFLPRRQSESQRERLEDVRAYVYAADRRVRNFRCGAKLRDRLPARVVITSE